MVRARWGAEAALKAPADSSDPFAHSQETAEVQTDVTDTEQAPVLERPDENTLWARRGETIHPMPLGYWHEDDYTMETPMETLGGRLDELGRREERGREAGIICPLKDKTDMTCSACPVNEVGMNTRKSALCRLGREQERVCALILAQRFGDGCGG